jgi:hypothetical protein
MKAHPFITSKFIKKADRTEIWTAYTGRTLSVEDFVLLLSVAPAFSSNHAGKGHFECLMMMMGGR